MDFLVRHYIKKVVVVFMGYLRFLYAFAPSRSVMYSYPASSSFLSSSFV